MDNYIVIKKIPNVDVDTEVVWDEDRQLYSCLDNNTGYYVFFTHHQILDNPEYFKNKNRIKDLEYFIGMERTLKVIYFALIKEGIINDNVLEDFDKKYPK